MAEMFEKASRMRLRFKLTGYGNLSVEDLWALTDTELNDAYMALAAKVKKAEVESLMTDSKRDSVLNLKLAIIHRIFDIKREERLARTDKARTRLKVERITEILAQKQDAALIGKTEEELRAYVEELKAKL